MPNWKLSSMSLGAEILKVHASFYLCWVEAELHHHFFVEREGKKEKDTGQEKAHKIVTIS